MTTCELRLSPIEPNIMTNLTHNSPNVLKIRNSLTLWCLLVVKERLDVNMPHRKQICIAAIFVSNCRI